MRKQNPQKIKCIEKSGPKNMCEEVKSEADSKLCLRRAGGGGGGGEGYCSQRMWQKNEWLWMRAATAGAIEITQWSVYTNCAAQKSWNALCESRAEMVIKMKECKWNVSLCRDSCRHENGLAGKIWLAPYGRYCREQTEREQVVSGILWRLLSSAQRKRKGSFELHSASHINKWLLFYDA